MLAAAVKEWTDERVALVARLAEDNYSASQIAAVLLVTRNAIIGIAHRRGIPFSRSHGQHIPRGQPRVPYKRKPRPRQTNKIVKPIVPVVTALEIREANVNALHLSIIDLEFGQCKYPYGDGPFTFCALPVFESRCYCAAHFSLTHNKTNDPPREKFRVSRFSGHIPVAA